MGVNLNAVEFPGYDRLPPWEIREMHSPFQIPSPTEVACPGCGGLYSTRGLGKHWSGSPECRPSLTEEQRELVTGMMMGDGTLHRGNKNPILKVNMTSPKYLEWLDQVFGVMATGVRLSKTATEAARKNRGTGFSPDALPEARNYQDQYSWWTRGLPELKGWDWYTDDGKKRWPDDLELTSTVLKAWYVSDGTWADHGPNDRIEITMNSEIDHTDKVDSYFENAGLPTPSNYNVQEHEDHVGCTAMFTKEDSYELFEYMAPAPPGFTRKFPERYHGTNPLKRRLREETWRGPFAAVTLTEEELRRVPLEPEINVDGTDRVTFDRHDLEEWLS